MKVNLYLIYMKVKEFYMRILIKNMKENFSKDFFMEMENNMNQIIIIIYIYIIKEILKIMKFVDMELNII